MEQVSPLKSANCLLPLGVTNAVKNVSANVAKNSAKFMNAMPTMPTLPTSVPWMALGIFLVLVVIFVGIMTHFSSQINTGFNTVVQNIRSSLGMSAKPTAPLDLGTPTTIAAPPAGTSTDRDDSMIEKILPPGGNPEVFNISKNTFTYYDAEPLCKALGAELATYDQVKSAWEKGADWCNYGWVKGQQALYPTQQDTWQKLQSGAEDQRQSCGNPGVNGGYFDNPELRFGVNCYGPKPSQSTNDATRAANGAPQNPGEIEFDKKVAKFRSEKDHVGILPFNGGKWND